MNRQRTESFGKPADHAHADDQRIDRDATDLVHQFFGGKRECRRIDFEKRHLVQSRYRRVAGSAFAVQIRCLANQFAASIRRQRPVALFDLHLALEHKAEGLAMLPVAHDHRGRRQDAPGRKAQQLPDVDIVELAQQGQAAHRLPFGLVRHLVVVFKDLEADRRQVLGHVRAQTVARVEIFLQRTADDLVGLFRNIRIELGNRHCLGIDDLVDQRRRIGAAERQATGEHLVEHHAERIQVGLVIQRIALDLLRAHVGRGPQAVDEGRIDVDVFLDVERQAEIHQLDLVVLGDQHVGRLDVAVHDATPVRVIQRHRDLEDDPHHAVHGQELVHGGEHLEPGALHQFHDQIGALWLDFPVIHPGDVGVVELCRDRCLGREQLAEPT